MFFIFSSVVKSARRFSGKAETAGSIRHPPSRLHGLFREVGFRPDADARPVPWEHRKHGAHVAGPRGQGCPRRTPTVHLRGTTLDQVPRDPRGRAPDRALRRDVRRYREGTPDRRRAAYRRRFPNPRQQ